MVSNKNMYLDIVDNEWWDHQSDIGSQKKTVERICWDHRPQDRQHQVVAENQRNWRQIQADDREWGHHLHRKTSPKMIANSFNRQFTTSKLGKHFSSRRTHQVSKDVKRMSLEEAESFTSAINSCRSSRAYGPDSLTIFHLKNLGPLATEHLTSLYNDSHKSCRLPSIWKTSLVIPIPKPGKDPSQGTSYKPITLLCPAAKVLEALI